MIFSQAEAFVSSVLLHNKMHCIRGYDVLLRRVAKQKRGFQSLLNRYCTVSKELTRLNKGFEVMLEAWHLFLYSLPLARHIHVYCVYSVNYGIDTRNERFISRESQIPEGSS